VSVELDVERDGPVTLLTLNRPDKANALSPDLVEALLASVSEAYRDGTRLLVLSGNGNHFCSGFDFSDFEVESEGELLRRFVRIEQLLQALYHAPFAALGLAHGKNFGAGVDLLVACAVRVAAPDTTFRLPGLRFGVQLGTRRLARRIGSEHARTMLAASKTVSAAHALSIGLIHRRTARDRWAEDILAERSRATALGAAAVTRLNAATAVDSRAEDMADLVASLVEPGLQDRIRAFRARG
jgi:enoyl-CoA hydratase/carnithine racemase